MPTASTATVRPPIPHEAVGQAPQSLILENLKLSANESQLSGTVEAALGETPRYDIQLTSSKLNLDNLLGYERAVHAENGEKTWLPLNRRWLPTAVMRINMI